MASVHSFLSEGRAEHKPLNQVLNKQSVEKAVCGFSVQMPLSLSGLSLQGEIRLSLSPPVNPLSHRWRMTICPGCRQKVCRIEW